MKRFVKLTALLILLFAPAALEASEAAAAESSSSEGEASKKPLPPPVPNGPDNIEPALHLDLKHLTKAQPPQVKDQELILTWKGDGSPRYVAAAFEHEAYRQKHIFWKNENGVYFLVYDLTSSTPETLNYRLIVDGLWQADATNPQRIRSSQGVTLNTVTIPSEALPAVHGPHQGYYGQVSFSYHGPSGRNISVIGNFNQWDPFATPLEETHPGEYHVTLTLPAGTVLYRLVDGTRSFLDPNNLHTGHDDQDMTFSYFENQVLKPVKVLDATLASASVHH